MGFQGEGTESRVEVMAPQIKAMRLHAEVMVFCVGVTVPHIKLMVLQIVLVVPQVGMIAFLVDVLAAHMDWRVTQAE